MQTTPKQKITFRVYDPSQFSFPYMKEPEERYVLNLK